MPRARRLRRRRGERAGGIERHAAPVRRRHLGVDGGDDRSRFGPANRHPLHGRRARRPDLDHEHRRLHVEHGRRGGARDHRSRRGGEPPRADRLHARGDGAPPGKRPVLQLVRPPHRREDHRLAAERRTPRAPPVLGGQRLARHRARGREPKRSGAGRPDRGDLRQHGFRLLLRPGTQPDPLPLRASDRQRALLLRHDRQREPDRELHRHRQGRASAQALFRGVPELHGHLRRPSLAGDQAPRVHSRLLRRERVRGRLSLQGLRRQRHAWSRRRGAGACSRR